MVEEEQPAAGLQSDEEDRRDDIVGKQESGGLNDDFTESMIQQQDAFQMNTNHQRPSQAAFGSTNNMEYIDH